MRSRRWRLRWCRTGSWPHSPRPCLPLHISQAFAGLVIVAIAGNAVENVVGIQLAMRNRMDYALSVTLQSPVQIALAVTPYQNES